MVHKQKPAAMEQRKVEIIPSCHTHRFPWFSCTFKVIELCCIKLCISENDYEGS